MSCTVFLAGFTSLEGKEYRVAAETETQESCGSNKIDVNLLHNSLEVGLLGPGWAEVLFHEIQGSRFL